jgi:hypothetical protein
MSPFNARSVYSLDYQAAPAARLPGANAESNHNRAAVAEQALAATLGENIDKMLITFMIVAGVLAYTVLGIIAVA